MELNGGLRVKEQELRLLPTSLRLQKNLKRSDTGNDEGSINRKHISQRKKINFHFKTVKKLVTELTCFHFSFQYQFLFFLLISQNRLLFACFFVLFLT